MKRKLPKSFFEKERPRIKDESKQDIRPVISSIKDERHKQKKLKYIENILITQNDRSCNPENGKEAFIKADQLYYFKKNKIKYTVMGYATDEIMDTIYEIIEILDKDDKLKINIKNIG